MNACLLPQTNTQKGKRPFSSIIDYVWLESKQTLHVFEACALQMNPWLV